MSAFFLSPLLEGEPNPPSDLVGSNDARIGPPTDVQEHIPLPREGGAEGSGVC